MEKLYIVFNGFVLAAMLLFVSVNADAESRGYVVWGDSQSFYVMDTEDASKNWPHLLQEATGKHWFNLSRGGRQIAHNDLGPYLDNNEIHADNQLADVLIIAAGSLDALFQSNYGPALDHAISQAQARAMDLVCLLPPDNGFMTNEVIRADLAATCPYSVDMSLCVGPADMIDPVHFGEDGHATYATCVLWDLALMGLAPAVTAPTREALRQQITQ